MPNSFQAFRPNWDPLKEKGFSAPKRSGAELFTRPRRQRKTVPTAYQPVARPSLAAVGTGGLMIESRCRRNSRKVEWVVVLAVGFSHRVAMGSIPYDPSCSSPLRMPLSRSRWNARLPQRTSLPRSLVNRVGCYFRISRLAFANMPIASRGNDYIVACALPQPSADLAEENGSPMADQKRGGLRSRTGTEAVDIQGVTELTTTAGWMKAASLLFLGRLPDALCSAPAQLHVPWSLAIDRTQQATPHDVGEYVG